MTTLRDFDPEEVDMFTVMLIGNSQTYQFQNRMVTPRGYYREQEKGEVGKGQEIMMNSFRKIEEEMQNKEIDLTVSGLYFMPYIPQRILKWRSWYIRIRRL